MNQKILRVTKIGQELQKKFCKNIQEIPNFTSSWF